MTVDFLIDWFSTIGDFPVIAFILAVIISGIPLVSMTEENRDKLCELSIKNLDSKGKFIQITYFLRCSFSKKIINQYNLKKKLVGLSILNVPPAFVWKIEK